MYEARCMEDVIRNHKATGKHFFDEDTMAFFGSKVVSELGPDNMFVTEEDNYDRSEKMYTVRQYDPTTTDIRDVSGFGAFKTLLSAMEFIQGD